MVEQLTPPDDDPLPATKLRLPRERAGTMSRPRLVHRLTDATTRELTLVCAPAGVRQDHPGGRLGPAARRRRRHPGRRRRRHLTRRTEGWAAGLQLAGLSLRDHPDPDGFVENFSGSHRHVLDYLAEEVLARQPDEVVRFLLETSVLDQVSGPLGEAVTGRGDSQPLLERIERANLFLVPLDDVRGWWRYHRLFADLLQARLRHAQPDRVPELHRAAAGWWEGPGPDAGRGQWPAAEHAIQHALAAGDPGWAARLIERHFDAAFHRAEEATLGRWLAVTPAAVVCSRPPSTSAGCSARSGARRRRPPAATGGPPPDLSSR